MVSKLGGPAGLEDRADRALGFTVADVERVKASGLCPHCCS